MSLAGDRTSQFHASPRRYAVNVDGVYIPIQSDISITEDMSQLTTVAEFSVATRGGSLPVEDQPLVIYWVDFHNHRKVPVFGGTIDSIEVESTPWSYRCRCVDQLAGLRRTKNGSDMNLTGMTDGEAWKAIADYCDVTYDDDDIADQGYILGARAPIYWLADGQTPGSSMIQELDSIFRCMTLTIGNNRVIRLNYDPFPPNGDQAKQTYTKGISLRWQAHHRSRGGSDTIQNVWNIKGVTIESEDNSCTTQPWARAVDGNEVLGGPGRKVVEQSVDSDLIQDTSLAEWIAKWKMGDTNRRAETGTANIFNDPNIHPGAVVGLHDGTQGIDANIRWALVQSVQRNGPVMTLTFTAGPAGDIGTITSGMDVQCNDTSSDGGDADDGFDPDDPGELPDTSLDDDDLTGIDDGTDPDTDGTDSPPPIDEPIVCTDPEAHTFIEGATSSPDHVSTYWRDRDSMKGDWTYAKMNGQTPLLNDVLVTLPTAKSGTLILTTNLDTFTSGASDDRIFLSNSQLVVCANLAVCGADTTIEFALLREDTKAAISLNVLWITKPDGVKVTGITPGTRYFNGQITIQNGDVVTDLDHTPGPISNGGTHRNTGTYFPYPPSTSAIGVPIDTPHPHPEDYKFYDVCAAFDLSSTAGYQNLYAFGDVGEGWATSEECLTPTCTGGVFTYTPNSHDFNLAFFVNRPSWIIGDCPPVIIRDFTLGVTDCEHNDAYKPPWERDDSDGDG